MYLRLIVTILFFVLAHTNASGQQDSLSKVDSTILNSTFIRLITVLEGSDSIMIKSMSLDSIHCILCDFSSDENYPLTSYIIHVDDFANRVLGENNEIPIELIKEKYHSNGYKIVGKMNYKSYAGHDIYEVWVQTHLQDEIAEGHEGGTMCFEFAQTATGFKFAGISSIP